MEGFASNQDRGFEQFLQEEVKLQEIRNKE